LLQRVFLIGMTRALTIPVGAPRPLRYCGRGSTCPLFDFP
jgi:hypothetical protein